MQRVLVVGMSGSGKTTLARALAARLGLPWHEMDGVVWGPGWTERPSLLDDVGRLAAGPSWVVDSWGYPPPVRSLLWPRADAVVWLDLPRRTVLPRLLRRSVRRTVRRERIFGGNREALRGWLSPDHPLWYAARTFSARRRTIRALLAAYPGIELVRLTTPAEVERWLGAQRRAGPDADAPQAAR